MARQSILRYVIQLARRLVSRFQPGRCIIQVAWRLDGSSVDSKIRHSAGSSARQSIPTWKVYYSGGSAAQRLVSRFEP